MMQLFTLHAPYPGNPAPAPRLYDVTLTVSLRAVIMADNGEDAANEIARRLERGEIQIGTDSWVIGEHVVMVKPRPAEEART